MSVIDANALDTAAFVARYRELFEHSPWVVERAARRRPFDDVFGGLMQVVYDASPDDQLALIRAHPELAGRAAIDRTSPPPPPPSRPRPAWTGSTKTNSTASTHSTTPTGSALDSPS